MQISFFHSGTEKVSTTPSVILSHIEVSTKAVSLQSIAVDGTSGIRVDLNAVDTAALVAAWGRTPEVQNFQEATKRAANLGMVLLAGTFLIAFLLGVWVG